MRYFLRLKSRKGFSYVMTSILIIVIMLICIAICEIIRINVMAAAVRDKYEDAIISVCTQQYAQMYQPIREGQAAAYKNTTGGSVWIKCDSTTKTQITRFMSSAMTDGEITQCEINSIDFTVTAPTYKGTDEKYAVSGTINVTIPYRFAWSDLLPIKLSLDVKSQWRAKF